MSDLDQELMALRRELAELRAGLQSIETQKQTRAPWDEMADRMRADMEKSGAAGAVGVTRAVVYLQVPHSHTTWASDHVYSDKSKLPPEEKLVELCAHLSNPLAPRALYALLGRWFEGQQMRVNTSELSAALGAGEADVVEALRPLVANDTVRWGKTADGQEYFQMERNDLLPLLLALT